MEDKQDEQQLCVCVSLCVCVCEREREMGKDMVMNEQTA